MTEVGLGEPNVVVSLVVNGSRITEQVPTRLHLADFLRRRVGLTGTHVGCEQGVCGMCTVIVDGQAVKSCLMLAAQCDGSGVETVESLAEGDELAPLQEMFKAHHGLQCGFCTPAFLMTTTALARGGARPGREELKQELAGVMCRCTGYEFILEAVEHFLAGSGEAVQDEAVQDEAVRDEAAGHD